MNPDLALALKLQREFELEDQNRNNQFVPPKTKTGVKRSRPVSPKRSTDHEGDDLNSTCNLVHPEWETLDPTPDIFTMFSAFDLKFFQKKLRCVELEWSKKMYQCAGICYQRRNGFGMSCTIRLSEPLLKLRPRKDLVQTLLHEMIHAYLFILNIREGNGGHGPNFKKMMDGINKIAGTNITVYHTFHDEVNLYKTHWWRCNGICQHRKPFYGYVRRTNNRAPGASDRWWSSHLSCCSGTFMKIKGPETSAKDKKEIKKSTKKVAAGKDIRNFFPTGTLSNRGSSTVVEKPKPKPKTDSTKKTNKTPVKSPTTNVTPSNNKKSENLGNVIGFKDINSTDPPPVKNVVAAFSGNGKSLGQSSSIDVTSGDVTTNIRNVWANRFPAPETNKRRKIEEPTTKPTSEWNQIDDDIAIHEEHIEVFEVSDDDSNEEIIKDVKPNLSLIKQSSQERQHTIKQEILGSDEEGDEDDIVLIDDEFDDDLDASMELADSSVIDDLFGEDTLLNDFKRNNQVCHNVKRDDEIINCPLCQEKMARETLEVHLDGCGGITISVKPKNFGKLIQHAVPTSFVTLPSASKSSKPHSRPSTSRPTTSRPTTSKPSNSGATSSKPSTSRPTTSKPSTSSPSTSENPKTVPLPMSKSSVEHELALCGYSEEEIRRVVADMDEMSSVVEGNFDDVSENVEMRPCPVCQKEIAVNQMNQHLDDCLLID